MVNVVFECPLACWVKALQGQIVNWLFFDTPCTCSERLCKIKLQHTKKESPFSAQPSFIQAKTIDAWLIVWCQFFSALAAVNVVSVVSRSTLSQSCCPGLDRLASMMGCHISCPIEKLDRAPIQLDKSVSDAKHHRLVRLRPDYSDGHCELWWTSPVFLVV